MFSYRSIHFSITVQLIAAFLMIQSAHAVGKDISPHHKLQDRLASAAAYYSSIKNSSADTLTTRLSKYAKDNRLTFIDNKILVEIFVADTSAAFLKRLSKFGITKDKGFGRLNYRVQALVSPGQLIALSKDRHVRWVQPPGTPHTQSKSAVH